MKMRTTFLLVLFLCLGAGSAIADCCDSFIGCAAAYATDGLSCVLQEIVSTVKHLIELMNNLTLRVSGNTQRASDEARQYVSQTIAQIRSDASQSSTALATALQQANAIYKQETALVSVSAGIAAQEAKPGTVAPPPPPPSPRPASANPTGGRQPVATPVVRRGIGATPAAPAPQQTSAPIAGDGATRPAVPVTQALPKHGELAGLFEKAVAEIQKAKASGDQDLPRVMQLMNQAEQSEGPALQSALAAADQAINEPIRKVVSFLNGMLADPTTIFDPTDIVNQAADNVLANLDTNINQMTNTITAGPQAAFDAAQGAHDDLVANGRRAQLLAAAMQTAYEQRTQAAQNALGALLPLTAVATGNATTARTVVPLGNIVAYGQIMNKFKSDKQQVAVAARQRMQVLVPALAEFKAVRAKAAAARAAAGTYKTNFNQKLTATFANKTQAEINTLRDQLVAQARSQYSGDPRTRDKVIALLQSETARLKAVPSR